MNTQKAQLKNMVYASLMAALTAAGAYITIPIGPVPITLQVLFIMLAGLLLGGRWGFISIVVYLLAGAAGLPVFAGGTGGIAKFAGPTGGYLIGFALAAFLIGTISEKGKGSILVDIIAVIVGTAVIYAAGVIWLKVVTGMDFVKAINVGIIPFIPGAVIKIAAAIPIARVIRPIINRAG